MPAIPAINMERSVPTPRADRAMPEQFVEKGDRHLTAVQNRREDETLALSQCPFSTGCELSRIAVLGGVYSNYLALAAALPDVRRRGADAIYCLGDLGAFGPFPDRVFPLLRDHGVQCIQGNYDNSV